MILTGVGTVQEIKRRVNGSGLTILTLRHSYAGQTVENGKWGERGNGFFQYRIFEENNMAGTNSNFVKFLDSIKPGAVVEVLADAIMTKTIKEGSTYNSATFTAIKLGYVNTMNSENAPRVAAVREEEDGFHDVEPDDEYGFVPDPIG